MVTRLSAAVLLTGLAFAAPALAEVVTESSYSLDLRESEGPVSLWLHGAPKVDAVLAQLPAVDLPDPVSDLAPRAETALIAGAIVAQLPVAEPLGLLAELAGDVAEQPFEVAVPDLPLVSLAVVSEKTSFDDVAAREGNENFAWMTAGFTDSDNLTTGSVLQLSQVRSVVGDHANVGQPIFEIMSPLTDDALRALELAAP